MYKSNAKLTVHIERQLNTYDIAIYQLTITNDNRAFTMYIEISNMHGTMVIGPINLNKTPIKPVKPSRA